MTLSNFLLQKSMVSEESHAQVDIKMQICRKKYGYCTFFCRFEGKICRFADKICRFADKFLQIYRQNFVCNSANFVCKSANLACKSAKKV